MTKTSEQSSSLYYFNARWLAARRVSATHTIHTFRRQRYCADDPSLGIFTSIDPIRDGPNWYVYCGNDPVNRVDWAGLVPKDVEEQARAEKLQNLTSNPNAGPSTLTSYERFLEIPLGQAYLNNGSYTCYLRAVYGVAEHVAGRNITEDEFEDFDQKALENKYYSTDYKYLNVLPDVIVNMVLDEWGIDKKVTYTETKTDDSQYSLMWYTSKDGNTTIADATHWALGNAKNQLLQDYYRPYDYSLARSITNKKNGGEYGFFSVQCEN
jgi:RHS repeat-associated protein